QNPKSHGSIQTLGQRPPETACPFRIAINSILLLLVALVERSDGQAAAAIRRSRFWTGILRGALDEDLMFTGKVVVITGGTGSFGRHILKGFLATDIAEIRIFSRDEKKQEEMRSAYNNPKLKFYIGDVRGYDSIHQACTDAHYVFHA